MPEVRNALALAASGTLTTGVKDRWIAPFPGQVVGLSAAVGTAPTGATAIFDLKKNGTSTFTTTANRPTVAISGTSTGATVSVPDVIDFAVGDVLTLDVIQIGSTVAGADARVVVEYVSK